MGIKVENKYRRGISPLFAEIFKQTKIFKFYKEHEDELALCIRNEYINIYYNGNSVCKIENSATKLKFTVNKKLLGGDDYKNILGKVIIEDYPSVDEDIIINNYATIKACIENQTKKHAEKIAQNQLFVNNNVNPNSNWFCVDLEYVKEKNKDIEEYNLEETYGRFDIIAVSKKKPYTVALIELKYGSSAIAGGIDGSGVVGHVKNFLKFLENDTFNEHLLDEIIDIIKSYEVLGIKTPFNNVSRDDFDKTPKICFITLDNKGDSARGTMQRYVLDGVKGKSSSNVEKVLCINLTKKNSANFNPDFIFSEDDGSNIKDIIDDKLYNIRTLI